MFGSRRYLPLLLAFAAYIALWLMIPRISFPVPHLDVIVFTAFFVAVQILLIRYICALRLSFAAAGSLFVVFLAAFSTLIVARLSYGAHGIPSLSIDISRILAATFLGYFVSFALREKNIVLPVAGFAAYLDIWTVAWGPTRQMMEAAPRIVEQVSAAMPVPGGHGQALSFIGPADFVFLAVFFGVLYRLEMEPRRTYWFLVPLLTVSMLGVVAVPAFERGLPGLVPMSVAIIAANYRCFRLQRQEKISVFLVAVVLLLALAVHLLHRTVR